MADPIWEETTAVAEPKWEETTDLLAPATSVPLQGAPASMLDISREANLPEAFRLPVPGLPSRPGEMAFMPDVLPGAEVPEKLESSIGKGLTQAGKDVRDTAAAASFLATSPNAAGLEDAYQQIVAPEEEKPLRQTLKTMPLVTRIPAEAAYGLAESSPRIAAMAGLQALGVPAWAAGGTAFGFTEEGVDPKSAAIGALLPTVGKLSGELTGLLAKQLGVEQGLVRNIIEAAGHVGGPTALLAADQARDIMKLPEDQRKEAIISAIANNIGFLALSIPGGLKTLSKPISKEARPVPVYTGTDAEGNPIFRPAPTPEISREAPTPGAVRAEGQLAPDVVSLGPLTLGAETKPLPTEFPSIAGPIGPVTAPVSREAEEAARVGGALAPDVLSAGPLSLGVGARPLPVAPRVETALRPPTAPVARPAEMVRPEGQLAPETVSAGPLKLGVSAKPRPVEAVSPAETAGEVRAALEPADTEKLNSISKTDRVNLGDRLFDAWQKRAELTEGSSGHKWNAVLTIRNNVEKKLRNLGLSDKRDVSGRTQIDRVSDELLREAVDRRDLGGTRARIERPAITEENIDQLKPDELAQLTHTAGLDYGATLKEGDLPRIREKYQQAQEELKKVFPTGDQEATYRAFGKNNFFGGALQTLTKGEEGPRGNYERWVAERGETRGAVTAAPAFKATVTDTANKLREGLKSDEFKHLAGGVEVVEGIDVLPDKLRRNLKATYGEDAKYLAAFYDLDSKRVIFNAAHPRILRAPGEALRDLVVHEVAIHRGLRAAWGENRFRQVSAQIFHTLKPEEVGELLGKGYEGRADIIGEEWLAHAAERVARESTKSTIWTKVVGMVRQAYRDWTGKDLKFTDQEIANLIAKGEKGAEKVSREFETDVQNRVLGAVEKPTEEVSPREDTLINTLVESGMSLDEANAVSRTVIDKGARSVDLETPVSVDEVNTRGAISRPGLEKEYKIFQPAVKPGVPLKERGVRFVEGVRTGISSKFRPLNKLAEDIAKAYGRTSSRDVAGMFEQLKGSSGKAEADIYRFDRDVSKLVRGREGDFNVYMMLRRTLDRLQQDQLDIQRALAGQNVPTLNRRAVSQYTIPEAEQKLQLLEQQLGPDVVRRFEDAADRYQAHMDKALQLQLSSGRMSQEVYDAIKAGNQFYAPFKLMRYVEETSKPEGTGKKIDTLADYTKAMKGIEDPEFKLGDMLAAGRQNIMLSRILADKATAMQEVARLATEDPQGYFVKRMFPGQEPPKGWETVNVFEQGKTVKYATNPDVAQTIQMFGPTGNKAMTKVLGAIASVFKTGATMLNVPFQVSNLMSDVTRAALVSKTGIRNVSDMIVYPLQLGKAFLSGISGQVLGYKNKMYQDFLDSGAAGVTVQEHLTPSAFQYVDPSLQSKAYRVAHKIVFTLPELAAAIEQTSKILGVQRAMKLANVTSGAELAKKAPEWVTEVRRFSGSPDFGRQGAIVEGYGLNLLYMFLNARLQGTIADLGRLTGRDGARTAAATWAKLLPAVGGFTAYTYYVNQQPGLKEDYAKRSQNEKNNYWLIPKSTYIVSPDGEILRDYWRLPKRESSKWIANMLESALVFAEKQDPEAAMKFGQNMIEDISPVNIQGKSFQERGESVLSSLNPLIKSPIQLTTGRDLFRHRDLIVSERMKKASPEKQYTERTAEAYKNLAEWMPDFLPDVMRSPIMIETATRDFTAGLFTQVLKQKPVEGRKGFEQWSILQRFQAMPYPDNQKFSEELDKLEREAADESLDRHRIAQKLVDDNPTAKPKDIIPKDADYKLTKHIVDVWLAKQNGATGNDRRLQALPSPQRAKYLMEQLKGMNTEQKQAAFKDWVKKRILTEAVFQEMGGMIPSEE